jgi:diguanylate cyclase (GGDEF)-like protein
MRAPARVRPLHWRQGLQFKLALLLAAGLLLLSVSTWLAGDYLVRSELMADSFRYERESAQRVADRFSALSEQVQELSNTLGTLAVQPGVPARTQFIAVAPTLVERSAASSLIVAVGVWPLPRTLDPTADRASLYLQRDAAGVFNPRADYNDPRAAPYYEESWFTPARYAAIDRCYWTPIYREALTRQEVVSCALPLHDGRGFVGVITISLSVIRLNEMFARFTAGSPGYSLLVGRDTRLLGVSDIAARRFGTKPPLNLVGLAQQEPKFNPLALTIHQQDEAFISAAVQSPAYDAATVSALKDSTRDLSRQEAELALASIWNQGARRDDGQNDKPRLLWFDDAVLGEPAFATLIELPQTFWRVVRVTSEREGFNGVHYFFNRTLLLVGGAALVTVLLIYLGINWLVLRPLRRMTGDLASADTAEDALHIQFDENADNEIGILSHWHNERVRQLREMMERTIATNSQLVVESDERRTAQEALAKAQERATLALQAVADGVIMTNERGIVEDINPVAEQWVGVSARNARGRVFTEVFKAQATREEASADAPLPNLAELAIQRGTRLEYANGVFLQGESQRDMELYVSVTPIRTRLNRVIGAIIVFRPATAAGNAEHALPDRRMIDAVTGLPNRLACDRAIRSLLDGVRITTRPHVLLVIDVDHLKRVNDSAGQQAGDEVLTRLGESIVSRVASAGEVFRMGADQFAVLLSNFDEERGRVFAEALRELLGNTRIYWESKAINVTVSIGLTAITDETHGPVDLMRRAEDACAAAKRAGRNAVMIYDNSLDRAERSADDAIWVRRIRAGLEQSLFHLTTQWAMPAQTHLLEGHVFDILLALEDEEGFWASPNAFLPVAERHHLIPEMDRWVIRNTLEYLARSPDTLERLAFCTINLSAGTLSDHSLVEYLAEQFQRQPEVPPRKLCFELREDALAEFPNQAQIFCEAMRSLGVRVAVDHFAGRSASDIALIRRLSIDFVKIDALHFRSLGTDAVEQLLAESLVRLARTLRKRVIVANLGDAGTLDAWRRLGADYLLGLAIAKPSPVVFYAPGG